MPERIEVAMRSSSSQWTATWATSIGVLAQIEGCEQWVEARAERQVQLAVREVAQARREAVAEEGHEAEDVVGRAAGVAACARTFGSTACSSMARPDWW